jgi:peroxiredoxin
MITMNAKIPEMMVQVVIHGEKKEMNTIELFEGKTVLFGLPGAFTPICSQTQLPDFAQQERALRDKGYNNIICMAVNDSFVMQAWKEQVTPTADIIMLADGSGLFTKALGLELDLTTKNMGIRCTRFLLVAEKGMVSRIDIEDNPSVCSVSGVSSLL